MVGGICCFSLLRSLVVQAAGIPVLYVRAAFRCTSALLLAGISLFCGNME